MDKDFQLLKTGDTLLGDDDDEKFRMPYLKGSVLCDLSQRFGLPQQYGASRWSVCVQKIPITIKLEFLRCQRKMVEVS